MKPDVATILFFHTVSIQEYGGSEGVRDPEALEAAVARPWSASFGREHFPTAYEKTAALAESIIRRHPFVDGNKRTGVSAGTYLLSTLGYELTATNEELEEFAVSVATGALILAEMARWFEDHSRET
ncbi:MAG: type II toxin-antitoxin system death-on-curing family toxin [Rubrobacter sp.]|nr:type II toxin-antitoxin system death-on-curing family toxin [Rubrobacter sp.]MDQ3362213.1 type II toxin-antitoxin system death-on-curing family toxin [Actinomycetota bacterium]